MSHRSCGVRSKKRQGLVQVIDADGERLELPHALAEAMYQAAALLAEGRPVTVLRDEEMLSTQATADILNVSAVSGPTGRCW
ncbi:hypothetical protein QN219_22645 [Sinorhizobium sp. 7-81]|uniref:hypothetical protein n=1 Tax=Sinorhizobium sp. 8-89 TaxID=3049089 RepID=UPI0024C34E28|nr:hypothetical protein [Sinorhizobium sp. 8-89]MDK1492828.1 hypothetical protein [Sinorhizobium sp. 8-89]